MGWLRKMAGRWPWAPWARAARWVRAIRRWRGWAAVRRTARDGRIQVLCLLVGLVFALWAILDWQLDPATGEEKRELFALMAQIVAGAIVLGGVYFAWRRIEVAREGQITERFTRAIEQLGDERLELRLGGVYALERVARDSERDHWPIMRGPDGLRPQACGLGGAAAGHAAARRGPA